jgi:chorismate mutase/prephenate dehydratase
MTRIESRPSRKRKWDYVFFLDLDGHAEEPRVLKALEKMKSKASLLKVLGAFPKAIL